MNLQDFAAFVAGHTPVVIVLTRDDYHQLKGAIPKTPSEWNAESMTYRGRPIVLSEFWESYLVEDTPDGPRVHMLR